MTRLRLAFCSLIAAFFISCGESPTATDTTRPWPIGDLSVRATQQGYQLRWTATGDDGNQGRASHYDVRYASSQLGTEWTSAHVVSPCPGPSAPGHPDSLSILGIGAGPWEFGVKIGDDAGNWSQVSNIVFASIDTIPPAAITDLEIRSTNQGFHLRWRAPGDNGNEGQASRYDIRYAATDLANGWESAHIVESPPVPAVGGAPDSASVLGIGMGPWEFALKTVDASGNWSALSNVVVTTVPDDATAPSPVTDLTVDMVTEASVILRWTASGDDGASGRAWAYDIRYAQVPITPETWSGASFASSPPPRPSGEGELFAVSGLHSGETFYLALRVLDETENSSELSNMVTASVSMPVQLTFDDNYGVSRPDWSPDGEHIAYGGTWYTQPYPIPAIYVIPATGGAPVRYTSFYSAGPSWSPDGSRFAFALYVDEETRTVLALMDATPEASPQILIDPGVKSTTGVKWSPDGASIAYVASSHFIGEPPTSDLYKIASAGGTPEHLTGGGWGIGGIDWSPDGTQIVYSSNESGNSDLWIMPSTGGASTPLANGPGKETTPAWSPDGSKIAFAGDEQVWILYLAEAYKTQVTFDPAKKVRQNIAWSPDGTKIAFGATMDGPEHPVSNIWVLTVH